MLGDTIGGGHVCPALWQTGLDGSAAPNQGRLPEKDDAAAGACHAEVVCAGHGRHTKHCSGHFAAGASRGCSMLLCRLSCSCFAQWPADSIPTIDQRTDFVQALKRYSISASKENDTSAVDEVCVCVYQLVTRGAFLTRASALQIQARLRVLTRV